MYRKIFILIFLLTAMVCAAADAKDEGPAVAASVDRRTIHIGDRIKYTLEVAAEENTELQLPRFPDDKIGDFEIKDFGSAVKKSIFGRQTESAWYYITSYGVGKHTIPEAVIRYRQKGEKDWHLKKARPIEIVVESVLPAGRLTDIKDIKGPLHFFEVQWIVVTGILLILISCVAIFIIYRAAKNAFPAKLPHETALEELEAIKGALAHTGDTKEYYVGVSDCIRHYIERVFRMKAPEMTTEEFLNSLKDSKALSDHHKDLLKEFLSACDLVKFAKYAPTREETEAVFVTAKGFIEETKPVVVQETPGAKR